MRLFLDSVAVGAAALSCLACGDVGVDAADTSSHAIVNGELDATHPAVVVVEGTRAFCSGTIVSVDPAEGVGVVLTAAHCLEGSVPLRIFQGQTYFDADAVYRVIEHTVDPAFAQPEHDVALVRFVGADGDTPWIEVASEAEDDTAAGDEVVAVGYGRVLPPPGGGRAERRFLDMEVVDQSPSLLTITGLGNICEGDSGGPILRTFAGSEKVVGVLSEGDDYCYLGGFAARATASRADFIDPFLDAPVEDSCQRCYFSQSSGRGACVDAYWHCAFTPSCMELGACLTECDSEQCAEHCAAEHREGIQDFLGYGLCACEPCDLCATEPVCEKVYALQRFGSAGTDAGSSADAGASIGDVRLSGGGGCSCRVQARKSTEGATWIALCGLIALARGRRRAPGRAVAPA